MRVVKGICFVVLLSSFLAAQSGAPADSDSTKIQKLLDAMAAQQKAIADQQQQISQQQQEIEKLKQKLNAQPEAVSSSSDSQVAHAINASLTIANPNPVARTVSDVAQDEKPKESPLSFKIGGADFTPGGFMDFTGIFRSVNTGNLGTNFFSIPFSNALGSHLTETRFTAQNSRVSLKATDKFGGNDVAGYIEMDFLGNDANNVFVTSNSHTLRQRLYFVQVRHGKFEVVAGQTWSWLTPNRTGLSPYPSDIFYSQNMDFNYQVGLTWARQPGVHFAYHANDNWTMGIALENPEQFGGQGEITFPTGFNTALLGQVDLASGGFPVNGAGNNTPNVHPDIIPKIAYDTNMGGKHFHVEAAGLLTGFKVANQILPVPAAGEPFVKHTKEGVGLEGAVNLEVVKNFRFVANGFWSDGGGRYVFGMGPDLVVLPNAAGNDLQISLVHSYSGIFGFEAQVTPKTMFYGYYGGAYFQRNFGVDTTAKAPQPFVGFGGPGSASSNNRAIQEPSLGWIQTFWKNPQYGALQLITQASYLTRSPWVPVVTGPAATPSVFKNAHLAMGWVDLRYVLP